MGRPLRFVRRGEIVEVTTRTIQGRLLTRPSKDLNEIFLGIVGRALVLYPDIKIFCIVVLSNHYHMLLKTPDGKVLRAFMNFVNGNLGKKVGRLHSWWEKFWGSRYRCIPVVDDDAVLKRFRYILAQGCKEGLVASPRHWPGVTWFAGFPGASHMVNIGPKTKRLAPQIARRVSADVFALLSRRR